MAPDLNAVAGGERFDYSTPGSSGYDIDQSVTWNDPNNRKMKVLTIGGGVTGYVAGLCIDKVWLSTDAMQYHDRLPDSKALCERGACHLREE